MAPCALPTVFCVLIWRKASLVRSFCRMLAVMGCISLAGWALIVVDALFGAMPENGFALFCAMAFGWAYVWVVGIPILVFSFLLRCCFDVGWCIRRKLTRREFVRGKPIWGVVLLLAMSLIAYPYMLTVRPKEQWHDWLIGRQGDRWRVYVHENGEIRCVDNEVLPDETKGTQ